MRGPMSILVNKISSEGKRSVSLWTAAHVAAINDGGTLNLNGAAGSYNAGPGGPVTISKPMTLKTYNAPATIIP